MYVQVRCVSLLSVGLLELKKTKNEMEVRDEKKEKKRKVSTCQTGAGCREKGGTTLVC